MLTVEPLLGLKLDNILSALPGRSTIICRLPTAIEGHISSALPAHCHMQGRCCTTRAPEVGAHAH